MYSLVNDYDDDELKVVQKIKYNEAVINARGDIAIAQANYDAMFAEQQKKKNLGDLLLSWAFADDSSQADVSVKRFSISFMKEAIAKGFEKFVESYRAMEKENTLSLSMIAPSLAAKMILLRQKRNWTRTMTRTSCATHSKINLS